MIFYQMSKYKRNAWNTPKILEKIVSAETLLTWTKGDRKSTNERRLSDNQNSTGRKKVDNSVTNMH